MGSITAAEERAERLQSLTFLGLLADDVTLAAIHYPTLSDRESRALRELSKLLSGEADSAKVFPRPRGMSDPITVFEQAVEAAQTEGPGESDTPDFAHLRTLIDGMLKGTADETETRQLQRLADVIGDVTLTLTERVSAERGADDWKLRALSFSAA